MKNELVKTENVNGWKIEIYRLSTPFGNFLSAYLDGQKVKRGPMLTVDDAVKIVRNEIDRRIADAANPPVYR